MLLAIDIGNTHTVVGVFDSDVPPPRRAERRAGEIDGLCGHWRVATVPDRTADELALLLFELLALDDIALPRRDRPVPAGRVVSGIAASSTVPALTGAVREMAARFFSCPIVIVEPGIHTGVPIRYENPREVGADRIANAVGALDLYGAPAVVVDLGTATTFDVVSGAGEYLGGAIVPGLQISLDALVGRAAALRRVELVEAPRRVIGRTTVESIQAGAIYGTAAMVDGMCRRIEDELGPATIIATGGLAELVVPHTTMVGFVEPWLTIHGLRILYARNVAEADLDHG